LNSVKDLEFLTSRGNWFQNLVVERKKEGCVNSPGSADLHNKIQATSPLSLKRILPPVLEKKAKEAMLTLYI
jgi:hypothetical protein